MTAVLRRSADRKVATNVRITKASVAKSLNSFGLPSGKAYSCPALLRFVRRFVTLVSWKRFIRALLLL